MHMQSNRETPWEQKKGNGMPADSNTMKKRHSWQYNKEKHTFLYYPLSLSQMVTKQVNRVCPCLFSFTWCQYILSSVLLPACFFLMGGVVTNWQRRFLVFVNVLLFACLLCVEFSQPYYDRPSHLITTTHLLLHTVSSLHHFITTALKAWKLLGPVLQAVELGSVLSVMLQSLIILYRQCK